MKLKRKRRRVRRCAQCSRIDASVRECKDGRARCFEHRQVPLFDLDLTSPKVAS